MVGLDKIFMLDWFGMGFYKHYNQCFVWMYDAVWSQIDSVCYSLVAAVGFVNSIVSIKHWELQVNFKHILSFKSDTVKSFADGDFYS